MSKRERVENVLKELENVISILPLEKELGFSRGKLYKFFKDGRKLSSKDINTIDKYLQKILDKYYD